MIGFSGLLNATALTGWRLWKDKIIRQRIADGSGVRNTLIVGAGSVGQALARYLAENRQLGYAVKGFLSDRNSDSLVLGSPSSWQHCPRAFHRGSVYHDSLGKRPGRIGGAGVAGSGWPSTWCPISSAPSGGACPSVRWRVPGNGAAPRAPSAVGIVVKRIMDIVLSALVCSSRCPMMAAVALVVKFDTPGPVFYRSSRVGKKGRRFVCYKFRTMVANADKLKQELKHLNERQGPLFKICNDPRLTRTGKLLRKYSLDELPQLLNVLKGEMSLVGPRPPVPEECAEYRLECLRRLDVKPGLTGLWQVTARRLPSFETTLVLDLDYIENWSLWLDLKILLRTLPAVLSGSGE